MSVHPRKTESSGHRDTPSGSPSTSRDPTGRNAIDGARHVQSRSVALDDWSHEYCKTLGKGQLSAGCRTAVRIAAACLRNHPQALFSSGRQTGSRAVKRLLDPALVRAGMRVAPTVSKADVEAIFLAMMLHQAGRSDTSS